MLDSGQASALHFVSTTSTHHGPAQPPLRQRAADLALAGPYYSHSVCVKCTGGRDEGGRVAGVRVRFWAEATMAALTGALAVLTLCWHDWTEAVFGVGPDHGNGSLEWLTVVVTAVVAVTFALLARRDWRAKPALQL
jgi:hypothetical protein